MYVGDVEVLRPCNGEGYLDGGYFIRWSGVFLDLSCFVRLPERGVIAAIIPEPATLDEGFNGVFEMDAIFSEMPMAPVILTTFAPVSPGICRGRARTFDSVVLEVDISTLHQGALVGSCLQIVFGESARGPLCSRGSRGLSSLLFSRVHRGGAAS